MTQLRRPAWRRLGNSASVTTRTFANKVAAGLAVVVLALVFGSSTALAQPESPRSGVLSVTKECSQNHGNAGDFCTITSSSLKVIKPGSRVVYLRAAGVNGYDTDVVLEAGRGNQAFGHVVLDFASATGTVTFNGGTGHFRHFHARAAVSHTNGFNWTWNGSYRFGSND